MLAEIIENLKEQRELLDAVDTDSEAPADQVVFRDALFSLNECIEQLESL